MKKNVENSKVLRAITLGLVAMLTVTATPMTAFAAEESGNGTEPNNGQAGAEVNPGATENNEAGGTQTQAGTPVSEIQSDVADTVVDATAASTEITEAQDAVNDMLNDQEVVAAISEEDAATLQSIQEDLTDGAEAVADAKADLEDAQRDMNAAASYESAANVMIGTANGQFAGAETDLQSVENIASSTTTEADTVIDDAGIANDASSTEAQARAAADRAVTNLADVETALVQVVNQYAEAEQKVQDAQTEYEAAKAQHEMALQEVADAKAKLADAKTDAATAKQELAEAQAKADALAEKVNTYKETQEDLEAIQDQYYSMLVYYYRATGAAAFNKEDGTLDLEASIAKSSKKYLSKNEYFTLGRYLTVQMIQYALEQDDTVDASTITIGATGNRNVTAQEGVVFKNSKGEDQTNTTETNRTNQQNEPVERGDHYNFKWNYTNQGDNGRTNHLIVTYTDKDGVEHTKNYNFILKEGKYEGDDFSTGTIYLAEITKNADGTYSYQEVEAGDYVMDDYKKLQKALSSIAYLNEYQAAKTAVDEAASKVATLESQIAQLESVKADSSAINALKKQLEKAQEDLEDAGITKRALEGKVQEARDAVAAIDLSRFNVTASAETSSGTTTVTKTAAVSDEELLSANPVLDTLDIAVNEEDAVADADRVTTTTVTAQTTAAGNVENETQLTEEAGADSVTVIDDEEVAQTDAPEAEEEAKENVAIDDDDVALASVIDGVSDETKQMSWWWLLIVAALGATGKALYEKHKEKMQKKADGDLNQ
ncbi:MAG: hypothetical protein K6A92_07315 [Lachnospiraceae bacterium]|nr:hypothetical protein [Lachnospiraceae bacterium]